MKTTTTLITDKGTITHEGTSGITITATRKGDGVNTLIEYSPATDDEMREAVCVLLCMLEDLDGEHNERTLSMTPMLLSLEDAAPLPQTLFRKLSERTQPRCKICGRRAYHDILLCSVHLRVMRMTALDAQYGSDPRMEGGHVA